MVSVIGLLSSIANDEPWMEQAICPQTDPELFFPEKGSSTKEAKRVCLDCPVREACLSYAMRTDQRFGVFGGLSERERRRLKATGMARRVVCNAGHNMDELGRTAQGTCRECHNKWNRMYQARSKGA